MGLWLKQSANGINFEEVKEREGVKSISRLSVWSDSVSRNNQLAQELINESLNKSAQST